MVERVILAGAAVCQDSDVFNWNYDNLERFFGVKRLGSGGQSRFSSAGPEGQNRRLGKLPDHRCLD